MLHETRVADDPVQGDPVARPLVFRKASYDDYLTFTPLDRAIQVDRAYRALESETWGEFRKRLGPTEYARLFADAFYEPKRGEDPEDYKDQDLEPADAEAFNPDRVPGFSDGDYPQWLALDMDLYLPEEILTRFGKLTDTIFNGSYYRIAPSQREGILEALRARGYAVQERGDLAFC